MHAVGLTQKSFARIGGISWRNVHRFLIGELPVPSFVHRILLCEEAMFALERLSRTDAPRVGKRAMLDIFAATREPITIGPAPAERRRKSYPKKRNLLAPRFLPQPDPASIPDEPLTSATWQQLATHVGEDAARALHERLARRRPRSPGRLPSDDGEPIARVTDPL
jgi:hypothetical protein